MSLVCQEYLILLLDKRRKSVARTGSCLLCRAYEAYDVRAYEAHDVRAYEAHDVGAYGTTAL